MTANRWTKEQLKLAFHLYCQLPFGKLHQRNPEIIKLANMIGRTPSAVAMKLVNFASLDPAITSTGRNGLGNASSMDREVWEEFHADWEKLAVECEMLRRNLDHTAPIEDEADEQLIPEDYTGETKKVIAEQRIKQNFFRRAVLSSYHGRCCMSGLISRQFKSHSPSVLTEAKSEFELLERHTHCSKPQIAGLYLKLLHGRTPVDLELDDWGDDGPWVGPLKWFHCTYMATLRIGFASGEEFESSLGAMSDLPSPMYICQEMIYYNGVYYGSWELQLIGN